MTHLRQHYQREGYVLLKAFLDPVRLAQVRHDAKQVFIRQLLHLKILSNSEPSEKIFEQAMVTYFQKDLEGFINCGKTCQHLISLHQLSLQSELIDILKKLGLETPNICTRPVLYFNAPKLAVEEVYYKSPPHQDWRSMQGSLNAAVIWVPLVTVDHALGALEIVPKSHLEGLQESVKDNWFRSIPAIPEERFVPVEVEVGDVLFFSSFLIHRSGRNVTDSIRWSCHFRYNDLSEKSFIERKYPNPYLYKPQQALITPQFPEPSQLKAYFLQNPSPVDEKEPG